MTTRVNPAVVSVLMDLTLDDSVTPWRMTHKSTGEPFTDHERRLVLNAQWAEIRAAHDIAAAMVEAYDADLHALNRFDELTRPYWAQLGDDAELGQVVAAMPPAEQAEALAILERLS